MEIQLNEIYESEYYDEIIYIQNNYKKILKNPEKKVKLASANALLLIDVSLVILIIFSLLFLFNNDFTPYFYVDIFFTVIIIIGIIYYILIKSSISKFKNKRFDRKLIIREDFVRLCVGDEETELKLSEIQHIIINKYSICFIPKSDDKKIIGVNKKYKEVIVKEFEQLNKVDFIVDNSKLY